MVGDFILDPLKSTGTVRTIDQMIKLLDYVQSEETVCCSVTSEIYVIRNKRGKLNGQVGGGHVVI